MTRLGLFIATCGYVGFAPVAPGTFGSAVGVVVFLLLRAMSASPAVELGLIVFLFVLGVWAASVAETALGRTDPGPVVMDEVVGMLMTTALLPLSATGLVVGFLLFRVLDIVKPWPASRLEALHGGLGIMADDAMAGLYGHLAMRALVWLLPAWML